MFICDKILVSCLQESLDRDKRTKRNMDKSVGGDITEEN